MYTVCLSGTGKHRCLMQSKSAPFYSPGNVTGSLLAPHVRCQVQYLFCGTAQDHKPEGRAAPPSPAQCARCRCPQRASHAESGVMSPVSSTWAPQMRKPRVPAGQITPDNCNGDVWPCTDRLEIRDVGIALLRPARGSSEVMGADPQGLTCGSASNHSTSAPLLF